MQTRNTILWYLNAFRGNIVHIMANISGQTEAKAGIILIGILAYIIGIVVLIILHRKITKRHKKIYENLTYLYDTIRYQVAKTQAGNPSIQDNKGIKVVIDTEHQNYLGNSKAIKEEINSLEQKLGQQIVLADQRTLLVKQTKTKKTLLIFIQLLWRIITVVTVGIYKLFW